jgi:2'-5' RNA ligase
MNTHHKNLYFIALVPHEELMAKVKSLKEEMRDKYGAKHALKSPAHITLIAPFSRPDGYEGFFIDAMQRFADGRETFEVHLSGFNSFPPRVIYIDIADPEPVRRLYLDIKKFLLDEMLLNQEELKSKFYPHLTLATRDLTRESYKRAWPIFEKSDFKNNFDVKSVFLLKHNGKFWDIYKEFKFKQE